LLIVVGIGAIAWTLVVWQWSDPFTGLHTAREQRRLAERYEALLGPFLSPPSSERRSP
jgi:hypothetical protein